MIIAKFYVTIFLFSLTLLSIVPYFSHAIFFSWNVDHYYIINKGFELITGTQQQIILFTIICGFLFFYANSHRVYEKNQENSIKIINNKSFIFSKKIHNFLLFLAILFLFSYLSLFDINFINGSDNYNVIGIKTLFETGITHYKYSVITDVFMLRAVDFFGFNFFSIKIPFFIYTLITLIFLCALIVHFNKNVILIASLIFVFSPGVIIMSNLTRDYSFDLMLATMLLYFSLYFYKAKNLHQLLINCILLLIISILTYLGIQFNGRPHSLIVLIIPFICVLNLVITYIGFQYKKKIMISIGFIATIIIGIYFFEKWPFSFGYNSLFDLNLYYFHLFFNPNVNTWSIFHKSGIEIVLILSSILFFILKKQKKTYGILWGIFIFGLFLYLFKYQTHLNYLPSRYIYFLYVIYIILLSFGIHQIFLQLSGKNKLYFMLLLLLNVNYTNLYYAISPIQAYYRENIHTLYIDNVGIGRFGIIPLKHYLINQLGYTKGDAPHTPLVLAGRYEEIILYMDFPMDIRLLQRPNGRKYNISQNTYVQSAYFQYHELNDALMRHKHFYFITEDSILLDEKGNFFTNLDNIHFNYKGYDFTFLDQIGGFRIFEYKIF